MQKRRYEWRVAAGLAGPIPSRAPGSCRHGFQSQKGGRARIGLASVCIGLLLFAGAAPAVWAGTSPETALQRVLEELVALPGGPPGAIVVIQGEHRRTVYRAGVARAGSEKPPRPNDHMRIASVAKAFSGAVILALVAEGVLSLDDTIAERRPDLPASWHSVSLRQLLNHTSGLPDLANSEAFFEAVTMSPASPPSPRELLDFVADEALLFQPGSEYRYSNSDNIAAALIAESATGTSYSELLEKEVQEPLGLRRTTLPSGVDLPAPFISGYAFSETLEPEDVSEAVAAGWAWASGGVVSTPADLSRFVRGYVGGRLFRGHTRAQQFHFVRDGNSQPRGPGLNAAGLALFRYKTQCGTVYGHTGNIAGYTQFIAATRSGRRSVAFTISTQVRDDLLPNLRHAYEIAVCAALAGRADEG